MRQIIFSLIIIAVVGGCKKQSATPTPPVTPPVIPAFNNTAARVNSVDAGQLLRDIPVAPVTKFSFSAPINRNTVNSNVSFSDIGGTVVNYTVSYENSDSILVIQPSTTLKYLTRYAINVATGLKSVADKELSGFSSVNFNTTIDSSRKFPLISDDALLDLVQQQTFKYFWDFGHPTSGLARERSNGDNNVVTTGGSGFGIMSIVTGINRNFITRIQGLARLQLITSFLKNTAQTVKGAYPHWMNGTTGTIISFSLKDNGADLVETSFLVQGLLCARQYFNGADPAETTLRADINAICDRVEWDWFNKNNENVLYWHYSTNYTWEMNHKIQGWNECLITYIMAASSTTHGISATVYTNGWAGNGSNGFINGNAYYGYTLPLGSPNGGPMFFSHYSFLGVNPNGLADAYANYATQTKNHTLINYSFCVANPNKNYGYSDQCWGLTASDIPNGYTASSPTNDVGVIAPTAAISSFPYTPTESMKALKFYYYTLGDKIFKDYGFVDAFALKDLWYASSFLAIDQGPIIVMIENYRSGLLWNLFTSCPEVKAGMKKLNFTAPYL